MDFNRFQSAEWYHAITLKERHASLRASGDNLSRADIDCDLAEEMLREWREQPPFNIEDYFAQRLATDGISDKDFLYLLGESVESIKRRIGKQPGWLREIEVAFSEANASDAEPFVLPRDWHHKETAGFLSLIEPLIRRGRERVRDGVRRLARASASLPFDPSTVVDLLSINLPRKLLAMMIRALVLELNVARLEKLLEGETPGQRFAKFVERLRDPLVALDFLQEYAPLARQLVNSIDQWAAFSLEFLEHLSADWRRICATLNSENDPGILTEVEGNAGDSHRSGRSVLVAKFSSGFQVVYKPRSLAVDVHFQELLAWLNERGSHPPFRLLRVVECGTHGWVEFVKHEPCASLEEIGRFYRRQGSYLALLYALEATDLHFENLIAAGEHPVLIDLESLFQPRVTGIDIKQPDIQLASQTAIHSVLRVGLLPQRMLSQDDYEGLDMSGLGGLAGQLSPERVIRWEGKGTDEMHVTRERVKLDERHHQPKLDGKAINVLDYTEDILDGFTNMYRLLIRHRDDLLSSHSPLARFAEDEVRAIVRDTYAYSLLLQESFHPDLLRDSLDRDRFFDKLWVGIENHPYRARVIAAEQADLHKGDVPIFYTRPNARHLWTSSNELIEDFFDETGLVLVERRIEQLCDEDLSKQVWFIRASLTTLSVDLAATKWPSYKAREPEILPNREMLIDAARAVGDRLEALSLRDSSDATWFGIDSVRETRCTLAALDHNLYEGIPGVALFLSYLASLTGEERYDELARAALMTLRRQIERGQSTIKRIGAFDGWGGIIYALSHLGALWNEPSLFDEASRIVESLPDLVAQDESFDIIGGSAGCIAALISLHTCELSEQALVVARQCGDRLIAGAKTMEQGVGWNTPVQAQKPPSGFSHGAAGIAWSLLKLHALTGEERFRDTALAGIVYERSLFSPEQGNWLDQRDMGSLGKSQENGKQRSVTAWCYGAPGIGLARLGTLSELDDVATRAEIEIALQTTLANGFGQNHSLCHGDFGNLELLLKAGELLESLQWSAHAERLGATIIESIKENGWLCGLPLGVEAPGLMTGLAGIGYGLLRLAEPTHVPSILLLEPPHPV